MLAAIFALSAAPALAQTPSPAEEFAQLAVGTFSSIDQARSDDRYDVVEAHIVRIWPERADGVWLYQEQAILGDDPARLDESARQRPYFQRVVKLETVGPGLVRRTWYELADPRAAIGAWRDPARLQAAQLAASTCFGLVRRVARGFWRGETEDCPTSWRGAVRAQNMSIVTPNAFANWDRGFDAEGRRIWGPEFGGYVFTRRESTP